MIYRRIFGVPGWEAKNPFSELENMRRQVDRLYQGLFNPNARPGAGVFPLINLTEGKDCFTIRAELPGVNEKDIELKLEANVLTMKAERKFDNEEKREDFHRVERQYGVFTRSFSLPNTVDPEKIRADYRSGILTITIPQKPEVRPREIPVNVG